MTDDANIVPFGKYKGQPVEAMMSDRDYCAWALAQPGLRARFAGLFTVIVNGGVAPDTPTPRHNRMQLLFRDPVMRTAVYRAILDAETVKQWKEKTTSVSFEVQGWDVVMRYPTIAIELKPMLGDDYPVVLRTMKMRMQRGRRAYEHEVSDICYYALIVDNFEAESASLDDLKWLFGCSRIRVRTLAEIYAEAV